MYHIHWHWCGMHHVSVVIHICVRPLHCSFQLIRAMREPQAVGASGNVRPSRFSFINPLINNVTELGLSEKMIRK